MMSHRILVTGFLPFLGESINPSEILLEHIKRDFAVSGNVDTLLLPVSFQQSYGKLEAQLNQRPYDFIFMLGQAGGRDKVCFERVALNWNETSKPDEDGYVPPQDRIDADDEPAFFTGLPLTEIVMKLKAKNLPASVSLSAGGYVCNFLYFKLLQKIRNDEKFAKAPKTMAMFIHVPYMPEQLAGKEPGTAAMSLEQMKQVLYPVLDKYAKGQDI